jgi:hypothetical protein
MAVVKKDGDWLNKHYDNLIHSTLPNMRYIPWGDLQGGADGGVTHEMAGVIDGLTWALKSPTGAWFSRWLAKSKRGLRRFYGETAIFYMLYTRHLKTKPAVPPLSFFGGDMHGGHFIARSSWKDDAAIVAFTCTDHFGDHHHYDQGSFTIYRRGLLAVDPPVYRKVAGPQQRTDVHNTLLIGGHTQRRARGQWFVSIADFKKNLNAGRRLEMGDITFHTEAGKWAAVAAQYPEAYPKGLVGNCVRQLLYVRPGTVVIVDHVVPPDWKALPEVQWLLQVPQKPKVQLGVVQASNGGSWLRCRPLYPGPSMPKVEATAVKTHRVSYQYERAGGLTLVHLIELGGPKRARKTEPTAKPTRAGMEVTLEGTTYLFADRAPFSVTEKKQEKK